MYPTKIGSKNILNDWIIFPTSSMVMKLMHNPYNKAKTKYLNPYRLFFVGQKKKIVRTINSYTIFKLEPISAYRVPSIDINAQS